MRPDHQGPSRDWSRILEIDVRKMDFIVRKKIDISGRVQGVGFRPFIYKLASEIGLGGLVGNNPQGVFIEIEGEESKVNSFIERLPREIPALAEITSLDVVEIPEMGEKEFTIQLSRNQGEQTADISPDVATCPDCLEDIFNNDNRRFGYPFTNCTNCGPRYSIIGSLPYDRPKTTMADFPMCSACRQEYDDPLDRRFHAQPNACHSCGPRLSLLDNQGEEIEGDPIRNLANMLQGGMIAAIKGLGGFHLACDAQNEDAVLRLRERKGREAKPFALMVDQLEEVKKIAITDEMAEEAMLHWSRPIMLLPKKLENGIAASVAPATNSLGIMLPYTPFHHLLFKEFQGPLVMTSGNPSSEPLCSDNDEALKRLREIADVFLMHDRRIERKVDDSVALYVRLSAEESLVTPLRRARGFAPKPIHLATKASSPVLALGGEMKSTICLYDKHKAIVSEHLGELSNAVSYRNFVGTVDQFNKLFDITPQVVACDMHPEYASTRYAKSLDLPRIEVQHHHAHIVSCMAENGISDQVIGVSCDGTGYGSDGNIWGCEIMTCDEAEYRRWGHMSYFPLLGGDSAARETWKPAAGSLYSVYGEDWLEENRDAFSNIDQLALQFAGARFLNGRNVVQTSSLGRLFDAAAFLLGVCPENRFEAEAAITLENLASSALDFPRLAFDFVDTDAGFEIDHRNFLTHFVELHRFGKYLPSEMALGFHHAVADALIDGVEKVAGETGIKKVALSGGCFANKILLIKLNRLLIDAGFEVLLHRQVPAGDGGISLGQAVIASKLNSRGK